MTFIDILQKEYVKVYGFPNGIRTCMNTLPGIIGDFRGMLQKAKEGEIVEEDYNLDDGKLSMHLTGKREEKKTVVTTAVINGKTYHVNTEIS